LSAFFAFPIASQDNSTLTVWGHNERFLFLGPSAPPPLRFDLFFVFRVTFAPVIDPIQPEKFPGRINFVCIEAIKLCDVLTQKETPLHGRQRRNARLVAPNSTSGHG